MKRRAEAVTTDDLSILAKFRKALPRRAPEPWRPVSQLPVRESDHGFAQTFVHKHLWVNWRIVPSGQVSVELRHMGGAKVSPMQLDDVLKAFFPKLEVETAFSGNDIIITPL